MGLLTKGTPLSWEDSKQYHAHVKKHGIIQFLNLYKKNKDRARETFLWGDETEALLMKIFPKEKKVRLLLKSDQILSKIRATKRILANRYPTAAWHNHFVPEYGQFQIEATPALPYGNSVHDLCLVELNMSLRRKIITQFLDKDEITLPLTCFPLMGVGDFVHPSMQAGGPVTLSKFVPDGCMGVHPRFPTLTGNIRKRRGTKVCIKIPLFQDENTKDAIDAELKKEPHKDVSKWEDEKVDPYREIYGDSMAFGMGCNCLQVTFQARSLPEARFLYDQHTVLAPILMALTAATPFFRGKLTDTDVRWNIISQSVDDRTPLERGMTSGQGESGQRIAKSRYDSVSHYISQSKHFKDKYNDKNVVYDHETFKTLTKAGVDDQLAKHVAHLYIRDPLVIYSEAIDLDDTKTSDHFENIQSTNWQTARFKPPPMISPIGWRCEFRSMEVQITDFENAAFTIFIALLSRSIVAFKMNLYMPISKMEENMKIAHQRDAVNKAKFFFRKGVDHKSTDELELMTMKEIFCGKESGSTQFPGLITVVESYLEKIKCSKNTRKKVNSYLQLIKLRACGKLPTFATWARNYIQKHPKYTKDSNISDEIAHDFIVKCHKVSIGEIAAPELLGDVGPHRQTSFQKFPVRREDSDKSAILRGASLFHNASSPDSIPITPSTTLNQFSALAAVTSIVADTGNIEDIRALSPTDATTNPSLLLAACSMSQYQYHIQDAIQYGKGDIVASMDRLAVNFGTEITNIVPGVVSTEVDARFSYDTDETIKKARRLIKLYAEKGVSKDRILIKIASTWEGIKAAEKLEQEGIHCNMTLIFCIAQAIACAEIGVTLISPFVGRITDWYKKANGVDGYLPAEDPGVQSVTKIYNYYKKHGHKTIIMGASFRNIGQILQLAGCDKLTIAPKFLKCMRESKESVLVHLVDHGKELEPLEKLDEKTFREMLKASTMATEKLAEGIERFSADAIKLENLLKEKM